MTLPKVPLTFKQPGRETVFSRDAVRSVKLLRGRPEALFRGQETAPRKWHLEVNDVTVYIGTEKGARRHQQRALRYIK